MPKYPVLYNRLSMQICPDFNPEYVEGDTAKLALADAFNYSFRRVYGEAAKSPDIVLYDGVNRVKYIAVNKRRKLTPEALEKRKFNGRNRVWDSKRKRWLFTYKK